VANVRAGAVDILTESTLSLEKIVALRDEWKGTGEGTVVQRPGTWNFAAVQLNQEWGRPAELRDVRARRGLYLAVDGDGLREFMLPGFSGTQPDTFMLSADPRASIVGRPFARYRFDQARATSDLAEVGWR